jgi:hypothetical protein
MRSHKKSRDETILHVWPILSPVSSPEPQRGETRQNEQQDAQDARGDARMLLSVVCQQLGIECPPPRPHLPHDRVEAPVVLRRVFSLTRRLMHCRGGIASTGTSDRQAKVVERVRHLLGTFAEPVLRYLARRCDRGFREGSFQQARRRSVPVYPNPLTNCRSSSTFGPDFYSAIGREQVLCGQRMSALQIESITLP